MYDARAVANYLLDLARSLEVRVTVMSLLKIVYFAHGWSLAQSGRPLVKNSFEAWKYGPVIRVVYDAFKSSGENPITDRAMRFDVTKAAFVEANEDIDTEAAELLESALKYYSRFHAFELSELTHEQGSPWHKIWNQSADSISLGMKIPDELIKAYFLSTKMNTRLN